MDVNFKMQNLTEREIEIIMREITKQPNNTLTTQDISYIAQTIIEETGITPQLHHINQYIQQHYQQHPIQTLFKTFELNPFQSNLQQYPNQQSRINKPNIQKKNSKQPIIYKCKRKVKPNNNMDIDQGINIQQKLQNLQAINNDCHTSTDKKNKKNYGKQTININENWNWFFNQYFYSNYDRPFFKTSILSNIFKQLNLDPSNLTYYQSRMLRRALPIPKLFNTDFINDEINALKEKRKEIRQIARSRQNNREDIVQLSANRSVIALHPICGHLHMGSILVPYRQNEHVVKFCKAELGTHKILDIYITSELTNNKQTIETNNSLNPNTINSNTQIIQNIDYEVMGIAIKLLDYKNKLIMKLKEYNDIAHQQTQSSKQSYLEQYGWIGTTINILSMGLKHIIAKFRIRGLFQNNQQQITNNFTSLLINPLNLMGREMENSSEVADNNIGSKIKQMILSQKERNSQEKLNQLMNKDIINNSQNHQQNHQQNQQHQQNHQQYQQNHQQHQQNHQQDHQPQDQENIQRLIRNCLGILVDLKINARDFDINQNRYLKSLLELTSNTYQQHFNEIFDRLHSIIKKVKEI